MVSDRAPPAREGDLGLDPEELRALLAPNGARSLAMAAFLGAASIGLGALAARASPWLALPLGAAAGFFVTGLVQLGHEAWHGNLFRKRWQNALFGHAFGLLFFVPFRASRHAHLAHHRHNRTERDPDAYNVGAPGPRVLAQFYVVASLGLVLAPLHFGVLYPCVFLRGRALREHAIELALGACAYAGAFFFVFAPHELARDLARAWLVALAFASPWNGLKSIADHYANTWKGDRFHVATTVRTHPAWAWAWSGLNYHLDHHLFPRVPGPNLPRLHARVRPALEGRGAPVFDGYARVFWRALRAGPTYVGDGHGFLRRGRP